MNKKSLAILAAISLIALIVIYGSGQVKKTDSNSYKIAVTEDAAGILMSNAAEISSGADIIKSTDISFMQLTDCCGTQAEFALAEGEFEMAVLCPDAASAFVKKEPDFIIWAPLVKCSNVILYKDNKPLNKIGYTHGKETLGKAVLNSLGNKTELIPMMRTALPYALERDAVDGIVVDVAEAVRSQENFKIEFLDYNEPTSVLVVEKQISDTETFKSFLAILNNCAKELNEDMTAAKFRSYFQLEASEEMIDIWKKSRIKYISIPNAE